RADRKGMRVIAGNRRGAAGDEAIGAAERGREDHEGADDESQQRVPAREAANVHLDPEGASHRRIPRNFLDRRAVLSRHDASAASARSITCTRTVAFAGLLVKLTWRADCQGSEVSCTEVSATAMQGRASASSSPRARKAVTARGTTEARIRKRNMEHSLARPAGTRRLMVGGV